MKSRMAVVLMMMLLAVALVAGVVVASNATEDAELDRLVQVMEERGFEAVAWCLRGDHHEQMEEYMKGLSEEDVQEIADLMREHGWESMAEVMESSGSDGMIAMHNSMRNMHGRGWGMRRMHAGLRRTRGCH